MRIIQVRAAEGSRLYEGDIVGDKYFYGEKDIRPSLVKQVDLFNQLNKVKPSVWPQKPFPMGRHSQLSVFSVSIRPPWGALVSTTHLIPSNHSHP